jgi:competence ComEA-like helix-hairpin-helix protein
MKMMKRVVPAVLMAMLLVVGFAGAEDTGAKSVVNINTADQPTLELLPRVGPSLSGRILAFREANGPFKSTDELVAVKGIGERSVESLKPYGTVQGETTLTEKVHLPRSKTSKAS